MSTSVGSVFVDKHLKLVLCAVINTLFLKLNIAETFRGENNITHCF